MSCVRNLFRRDLVVAPKDRPFLNEVSLSPLAPCVTFGHTCTRALFSFQTVTSSMLEEMNKMNEESAALRAEKQELAARIRLNDPAQAKRPLAG